MSSTGIFVLGMHRSGTSALARIVNLIGVPLDSKRDDFSPDTSNPRGYWESRPLSFFQDVLLDRLGGSWAAPPKLKPGWESSIGLRDAVGRGRRVFKSLYDGASLWAWKDPRTAITLPFWLRALRVRPILIVIHRHPLEVSRSLAARSSMPTCDALALWERYNRSILQNAAHLPTFVTSFQRLLDNAPTESAHISMFLRNVGVRLSAEASPDAIGSFVESSLRHSVYEDVDMLRDEVTPEQRELRALLNGLEGGHDVLPTVPLPRESPALEGILERRRALPQHGRRGRLDG